MENSRVLSCDGEENVHCSDSVPASSYSAGDHIGPYCEPPFSGVCTAVGTLTSRLAVGVQFGQAPCRDYNTTSTQYGL